MVAHSVTFYKKSSSLIVLGIFLLLSRVFYFLLSFHLNDKTYRPKHMTTTLQQRYYNSKMCILLLDLNVTLYYAKSLSIIKWQNNIQLSILWIRVRSTFWTETRKKKKKTWKRRKNQLSDHVICKLFSMCVTAPISPLFTKVHLRWDLNRIRRGYFSSFTFFTKVFSLSLSLSIKHIVICAI